MAMAAMRGGNFVYQVGSLSRNFNLYVPDLLFFGQSSSKRSGRTDAFQARCLAECLKRFGVDKFSVYSISYGGFVAYRMAEICPEEVEKVVIVSSGVGCSDDQIEEQIKKIGRDPAEILLPKHPQDLRLLVNLSVYKCKPLRWLPDFFLQEFINVMVNHQRKEKLELLEHLLAKKALISLPILTQETLLVWGDQDNVHLGPRSRVKIIKEMGHAANIESPGAVNDLITSFVLGRSKWDIPSDSEKFNFS
ncbi:hypothetical protein OIU79_007997 [Salix purpurea]|uniref:AB hydrolase-1 domain-containing protein n=1 Tax=Salix purpurea TaxID=77065 RepID=A0A9Q0YVQ4_SALPP|nr:hypothetical protein OIU79_007997 [Salix purpurea]